jgi:hypothetical protein
MRSPSFDRSGLTSGCENNRVTCGAADVRSSVKASTTSSRDVMGVEPTCMSHAPRILVLHPCILAAGVLGEIDARWTRPSRTNKFNPPVACIVRSNFRRSTVCSKAMWYVSGDMYTIIMSCVPILKSFTSSAAKLWRPVGVTWAARALVGRGGSSVSVRRGRWTCLQVSGMDHGLENASTFSNSGHGTITLKTVPGLVYNDVRGPSSREAPCNGGSSGRTPKSYKSWAAGGRED